MKSSTHFGWFDRTGARHSASGDTNIATANIVSTATIYGLTGTALVSTACSVDGQTSCLANSPFKAAKTSAYNAWDIRAGKTLGGIAGNINFYKGTADLSTYDRDSGPGAISSASVADDYDLIDDLNTSKSFPTIAPSGWVAPTGNWLMMYDSTGNACNGTTDCVYEDQTTGLIWIVPNTVTKVSWETAISSCNSKSFGPLTSGWRMPTQKELLQAYIDGIRSISVNSTNNSFWSSTTYSSNGSYADVVNLAVGVGGIGDKTDSLNIPYICVQ